MGNKTKTRSPNIKIINEEHPDFMIRCVTSFQKHKDAYSYVLMGIVIIAAITTLVIMNNRTKEREAAVKLQSALSIYQNELMANVQGTAQQKPDAAPAEGEADSQAPGKFREVIENYPGTHSSDNATYMLAASLLNSGKYSEAIDTYQEFRRENQNHPLRTYCLIGIATAQFNMGAVEKSLESLKSYEKESKDQLLMDLVTFETAKRYESMGNWSAARKSYQTVVEKYPDSPWLQTSEDKLQDIDRKHPGSEETVS